MKVKFWDGTEKQAETREDAVRIVKAGLEGWRQEGDRIVWRLINGDKKLPSLAQVVDELGEETDAFAVIGDMEAMYIYCKDCKEFVDRWKYDTIDDAGHKDCNYRPVTEEELANCVADCIEFGCFEDEG